jgi:hypothetical protein
VGALRAAPSACACMAQGAPWTESPAQAPPPGPPPPPPPPPPRLPPPTPQRSLHDALCVLSETVKDSRVVYGGGWPELRMSLAVEEAAKKTPGAHAARRGALRAGRGPRRKEGGRSNARRS